MQGGIRPPAVAREATAKAARREAVLLQGCRNLGGAEGFPEGSGRDGRTERFEDRHSRGRLRLRADGDSLRAGED